MLQFVWVILLRLCPAYAYEALVTSVLAAGMPKMLILLCLLLPWPEFPRTASGACCPCCLVVLICSFLACALRIWNRELPITPKWDAVDLFCGTGQVQARNLLVSRNACGL